MHGLAHGFPRCVAVWTAALATTEAFRVDGFECHGVSFRCLVWGTKKPSIAAGLVVLIMLIRSGFHFFSFDGDSEIDPKSSILFWQKIGIFSWGLLAKTRFRRSPPRPPKSPSKIPPVSDVTETISTPPRGSQRPFFFQKLPEKTGFRGVFSVVSDPVFTDASGSCRCRGQIFSLSVACRILAGSRSFWCVF